MAARDRGRMWEPLSSMVLECAGDWDITSPLDSFIPYNSSHFDYGFTERPQDTWTSINAGFAAFRWNLARNLTITPEGPGFSSLSPDSIIEAGYCIFYPSMQIISARVQNGVYEEHVINSTIQIQPYHNRQKKYDINQYDTGDLTYTYYSACRKPTKDCEQEVNSQPVNITIPRQRYSTVVSAIRDVLPFAFVTTTYTDVFGRGDRNPVAAEMLYKSPNITATMHTVAHYISVALRANDTILERQNDPKNTTGIPTDYVAPSHRVAGTVYVQTILLHVRWGWLAFPTTLMLIVAGVLIETIRTSQHESIGVWKDNPLTLLLNTRWRPESDMVGAATSAELNEIAKDLEVSLVRGDGTEGTQRTVIIRKRSPK